MPNFGKIFFQSARSSGISFKQLGSGTPDFIKFCGSAGITTGVEVGSFQDTSFMTDSAGNIPSYLGSESGKLTNVKYISDTIAKVSGFPNKSLVLINKFFPANLNTYPNFTHRASGTLFIRYVASGVSTVNTYNAKIFAYDRDVGINQPHPDVTAMFFEINASGQWFNAAESGKWKAGNGNNDAYFFTNHSAVLGWRKKNTHCWVACISLKPNSIGNFSDIGFGFSTQYA